MSHWSPVYFPEIETGRHVKNNVCAVEIKIKWMIRKHMTYENTYHDDRTFTNTINKILWCIWVYLGKTSILFQLGKNRYCTSTDPSVF
jgi:hypothetical protein